MITRYLPALLLLLPFFAAGRESKDAEALARSNTKPLAFIENKGQIVDQNSKHRNDIDAKLEANGLTVFVGDGAIHYQWTRVTGASGHTPSSPFQGGIDPLHSKFQITDQPSEPSPTEIYRMDVELVGANKNAQLVRGQQQEYFENYYLAQCPDGVKAGSFNKITYKNVYPGIDWVLYSKNNELKYDFIVHAGSDVKDIKLRYSGATSVYVKEGALIAETPFGSITEQKPYSYDAATKKEVASSFVVEGNELRFDVAATSNELVIDPNLKWATYYGGSGDDIGQGVAFDSVGNVYLVGSTTSTGNIATTGAFQTTFGGGDTDGMLVKFNGNGVRQWATYYGGSADESIGSIAYGAPGYLYVGGATFSTTGIATTGSHQPNNYNPTYSDLYLAKFDLSGSRQWGTYYGGERNEGGGMVACDGAGNIFLAGSTSSDTNVATPGCSQPVHANVLFYKGSTDCLIAKFTPSGTRLWGTYFGGIGPEWFLSIACDPWGNVYAAGGTECGITNSVIPTSPGCFQSSGSGIWDGLLVKYNSNGTRLWSTYYGGNSDEVLSIVTCKGTEVYFGGRTSSTTNMATTGAFQTTKTSNDDGFLARFDSSGNRIWGTYIGGNGNETLNGIAVGPVNNLYIAGCAPNSTNLATPGAFQTSPGGNNDIYFAEFTNGGTRKWTSYYGSTGDESSLGQYSSLITYDATGDRLYLVSHTTSISAVASSNGHQYTFGGIEDALLVKFEPDTIAYIAQPYKDTALCTGSTLKLTYKTAPGFASNNTFTAQLSDANGNFASPVTIGTKNSGISDTIVCTIPLNTITGTGYRIRIVGTNPAYTSIDNSINIRINSPISIAATTNSPVCSGSLLTLAVTGSAGATYNWAGPLAYTSSQQNPVISNVTASQGGDYVVTVALGGCTMKDTVTITVKPTPATPTALSNSPVCAGGALNLSATTTPAGASYKWNGPNGFASTMQNPVITPATMADAGIYDVQAELNGCTSAAGITTVVVNTVSSLVIYPSPNDTICIGSNVTFVSVPQNAGTSPQYQWYKNGIAITGASGATYSTNNVATGDSMYCIMTVTGVCSGPLSIESNKIGITALQPSPGATVSISADPGLLLSPWQLVKFTATVVGADSTTKYQWQRNSQNVIGATSNNWSAYNLSDNDTITCIIVSDIACTLPPRDTSNKMVVNIKTGIEDIAKKGGVKLYPNPNNGSFVLHLPLTPSRGGHVSVDVVNAVGQRVYSNSELQITDHQLEITLPVSVANGVYMLKLQHEEGTEAIRFTVAR